MSRGQDVFRQIVEKLAPAALVEIGEPSQGRYPVTIVTPKKSTRLYIPEEDFADLAHNGGRRADITMHVRIALEEERRPKWTAET